MDTINFNIAGVQGNRHGIIYQMVRTRARA
jgi:hypothetical protein